MAGRKGPNPTRALGALCYVLAHAATRERETLLDRAFRRLFMNTRKLPAVGSVEWARWWADAQVSMVEAVGVVQDSLPVSSYRNTAVADAVVPVKQWAWRIQTASEESRRLHRAAMAAKPSMLDGPGRCRVCGCTDDHACAGGCGWADESRTICTTCAAPSTPEGG